MADERVTDPTGFDSEFAAESALRPRVLAEFVGQEKLRAQLRLTLEAAARRGIAPDHVLLSGPPGLGKTTLAMIVAAESAGSLRLTSGPAIQRWQRRSDDVWRCFALPIRRTGVQSRSTW